MFVWLYFIVMRQPIDRLLLLSQSNPTTSPVARGAASPGTANRSLERGPPFHPARPRDAGRESWGCPAGKFGLARVEVHVDAVPHG